MNKVLSIFSIIILILLISCSKKSGSSDINIKDTIPPAITLISPINNQVYIAGDTIKTKASAVDNVKVTELHIHVSDNISGKLLRDIHSYPDALTGTVQDAFVAVAASNLNIRIISFDPSQNLGTVSINVTVNP